jgi:hypothetical protein
LKTKSSVFFEPKQVNHKNKALVQNHFVLQNWTRGGPVIRGVWVHSVKNCVPLATLAFEDFGQLAVMQKTYSVLKCINMD